MSKTQSERFITLDVFRGMTIFLMIVVNTPGGGVMPYSPLEHAQWNGCTLTDLVFPSFLFAVGNAMSFSMRKFESKAQKKVLYKIFKRTLLIFLVGYLLTWYTTIHFVNGKPAFTPFAQTRIMAGITAHCIMLRPCCINCALFFNPRDHYFFYYFVIPVLVAIIQFRRAGNAIFCNRQCSKAN